MTELEKLFSVFENKSLGKIRTLGNDLAYMGISSMGEAGQIQEYASRSILDDAHYVNNCSILNEEEEVEVVDFLPELDIDGSVWVPPPNRRKRRKRHPVRPRGTKSVC